MHREIFLQVFSDLPFLPPPTDFQTDRKPNHQQTTRKGSRESNNGFQEMLSALRRVSLSVSLPIPSRRPQFPPSTNKLLMMDPTNCFVGSDRLTALARQLRMYRIPPCSRGDDEEEEEEQRAEDGAGKVVSQVGFAESSTPVARRRPETFRPKRAAVLVCLFEGDCGDLRVILTKRSSRLSTHSG